jgi:hypothetical protein
MLHLIAYLLKFDTGKSLVGLGYKNSGGTTFLDSTEFDGPCANYTGKLGDAPSI